MGITIHFQGTLKNTNLFDPLVEELVDISKTLNWEWEILEEGWPKRSTKKVEHNKSDEIPALALRGININLHPDSEQLSLFFDSNGRITTAMNLILVKEGKIKKEDSGSFVKTQFAPPDVHISIIKLLKYLKKRYIPDLKVIDEGEYWETEDREKLIEKMGFLDEKMDLLEDVLSNVEIENAEELSWEQLAVRLAQVLKKRLEGGEGRQPKD